MAQNTVSRKIHFFRADCGQAPDGSPLDFEPTTVLQHVAGLPFNPQGRYFDDGSNVYCAWVDRPTRYARLRFAVIRREGLPFVEEAGMLSALNIPDAAGLVEQVHIRCFPNNIVACDFNSFGPRLPKLRDYLRARGGDPNFDVAFEPLVRRDVAQLLERFDGVRIFNFRVRKADLELIADADRDLASALEAQAALGDADEYEVVLRPRAYSRDQDLGARLFRKVQRLVRRPEVVDAARAFRVEGTIDGQPSVPLNILDERLVSEQDVAKEPGRGRALNRESAYEAIGAAAEELSDAIAAASAIADGQP